jgi:hypothetical protein
MFVSSLASLPRYIIIHALSLSLISQIDRLMVCERKSMPRKEQRLTLMRPGPERREEG